MAAVPIYVWNGTAWQETGPVIPASPIKYQASAPSSPSTGDIWIDSDADVTTGSQQFQRFRFVASGGETSVSGVDANGAVLAYTAGTEIVVLNGSTLVRGSDYTATNGTSVTGLSPALVASDVLEVFSFMAFNVANTYTQTQVDALLENYMGQRLVIPTSVANGTISSTGAVSFTGASSVSLNGCFTSTYDNYKILVSGTASATSASSLYVRFRTSGSDNTTSSYFEWDYSRSNTAASNGYGSSTTGLFGAVGNIFWHVSADIFQPQIASNTGYSSLNSCLANSNNTSNWIMGQFYGSTQFDGFTLYPSTGTITGTVRVYGYKN